MKDPYRRGEALYANIIILGTSAKVGKQTRIFRHLHKSGFLFYLHIHSWILDSPCWIVDTKKPHPFG